MCKLGGNHAVRRQSITPNSRPNDGVERVRHSATLMKAVAACARGRALAGCRSRVARALRTAEAGVLLIAFALAPLEAAQAALGENIASLARDHEALRATLLVTPMQGYDVHQLVSASGVTVREYATHTGHVFAVTWSGMQVPDLKVLLGTYFERYVLLARSHRTGHHVLSINTPDLVMTSIRIQRMATGQAYVPGLLPSGVSRRELR